MATSIQKKDFIERIAPLAQKAYRQFGKPLPSICIAMAAVECKWGLAGSCKYNSFLGQKVGTGKTATKYWSGSYFNAKTQEVISQSTGQLKTIRDNFRAYDSMEQCIFNYYELLNTSLYKRVLKGSSYQEQMKQIKACGYMTSVTEVNTCLDIISQNDLTQYDPEGPEPGAGENSCYPAVDYKGCSIVEALKLIGVDYSYASRKRIAGVNGIAGYTGTSKQNMELLNRLRAGKLKRV